MANCPHCEKEIKGMMTQEKLEARLRGQKEAALAREALLKGTAEDATAALAAAQEQIAAAGDWRTRAEEAEGQIQAHAQGSTLATHGLDQRYQASALTMWQAHVAGQEEDAEPLTLDAYLSGPAREDDCLLAVHLGDIGEGGGEGAETHTETREATRSRLPLSNSNSRPPPRKRTKMSVVEVQRRIDSPEFRSLTHEKRREEMADLLKITGP